VVLDTKITPTATRGLTLFLESCLKKPSSLSEVTEPLQEGNILKARDGSGGGGLDRLHVKGLLTLR